MSNPDIVSVEFDAQSRAEQVYKACKGLGTDESALSRAVCDLLPEQYDELRKVYRQVYDKSLLKLLISETSGSYCKLLTSLCSSRPLFIAVTIEAALRGAKKKDADEPDYCLLNDVVFGLTDEEITGAKAAYQAKYDGTLEDRIRDRVSDQLYRDVIISFLQGRPEESEPAKDDVNKDVNDIVEKLRDEAPDDPYGAARLMVSRSRAALYEIQNVYATRYNAPLSDLIRVRYGVTPAGLSLVSLLAAASYKSPQTGAVWPVGHYARIMQRCLTAKKNDNRLIRAITLSSPYREIVPGAYKQIAGADLVDTLASELKFDFKVLAVFVFNHGEDKK